MTNIYKNFTALYGTTAPGRLVAMYKAADGAARYIQRYWNTQHFQDYPRDVSDGYRGLRVLLAVGMAGQLLAGLLLVQRGLFGEVTGAAYVGLALIISYPIVWAHILFFMAALWRLTSSKSYGKAILCWLLERQVKLLRRRNDFTLIAVAGSVGKTSTKLAIAAMLQASGKRVCFQTGNYNDRLTVPLVLFGETEPSIFDIPAWLRLLRTNHKKLRHTYPFDFAIVELGTDGPGQMARFAYLRPELTVLTAVAEEHMAYFKTIAAVAEEECAVFDYSSQVLVNTDDVALEYCRGDSFVSFGLAAKDYHVQLIGQPTQKGQKSIYNLRGVTITGQSHFLGNQGAKIGLAAAAVAHMVGIDNMIIQTSMSQLQPFSGRMQILPGVEQSTLIDDTYNASPVAVTAALDVLYSMDADQRIAILGSMNELGDVSPGAHEAIGDYCDPDKLDLVITIGQQAQQYLAPAATKRGCEVKSFMDPLAAGNYVKTQLKTGAVVLAKGSQNGVFAEEAIKPLLLNKEDASKLVRQSPYWLSVKHAQLVDQELLAPVGHTAEA